MSSDLFNPRMPEVDLRPDMEALFLRARAAAAEPVQDEDGIFHRQVIIVTPGRLLIGKECPLPAQIPQQQIAILESLVPRKPSRQIAVIAYTLLNALKSDMRRAIPFIDYLLGFATLGHSVWIFEGHPTALTAGCRGADLLLVDEGMLPALETQLDWRALALAGMHAPEIKLIARQSASE